MKKGKREREREKKRKMQICSCLYFESAGSMFLEMVNAVRHFFLKKYLRNLLSH